MICASHGLRVKVSMLQVLSPYCLWDSMEVDTGDFLCQCLDCMHTKAGELLPRPLGQLVRGRGWATPTS